LKAVLFLTVLLFNPVNVAKLPQLERHDSSVIIWIILPFHFWLFYQALQKAENYFTREAHDT
jgi:ABC-type Co2+ transport system permease subunit